MKLITKTILYYLLLSIPLLVIAGVFGYFSIKKEMSDATNEYLIKEKLNAEKLIKFQKSPAVIYLSTDSLSKASPVNFMRTGYVFADSIIYDKYEEEELNYRILKSYFNFNHQNYLIVVSKSTLEDDDLMESLLKVFVLIVALLTFAFFILSWILSKTIWKPFYKTMDHLNAYDIKDHQPFVFEKVSTMEFKKLNQTLEEMTNKIYSDYICQKEFTENAAHEMQTPLAVIKANVNLLMQSPHMGSDEMNQVQSIDNTVKKISSLNKALLLLSKIENNQFNEIKQISLPETVNSVLANYQELIEAKGIEVKKHSSENVELKMNPMLSEILISNLIQNAIRHNKPKGKINIDISDKHLLISNTGDPLTIDPSDLFVRFKKNDTSKDSLGLGLSIVESIVKLYGFKIEYHYNEGFHNFQLNF